MSCTRPGAVTTADIVAYIDGEAGLAVVEHVRECAGCAAEARAAGRVQSRLRGALRRFDCPSAHSLGEYELGVLDAEQQRLLAAHVETCPECAGELRMLRTYLAT
jgi:anti-sigma factor RsiW